MGYQLHIDNYYTSDRLFHYLCENETVAWNENMLMVPYKDKKGICFLSIIYGMKTESVKT